MKHKATINELKFVCPDIRREIVVKHDFKIGADKLTAKYEEKYTIHAVVENCPLCDKTHVVDVERFY